MKFHTEPKSFLDFSVGFDGKVEGIELYLVNQQDKTDDIPFEKVDEFVSKLEEVCPNFFLSEHRTLVNVWFFPTYMSISFSTYNSPSDHDFDDHFIKQVPLVEFSV